MMALHALTDMLKWLWYDAARTHLEHYECKGETCIHHIFMLDETWARSYEPKLKCQSNEWRHYKSPWKRKVHQTPTTVKVMVILEYDCGCVILKNTEPQQHTINTELYSSFWKCNLRPVLEVWFFLQNPPIILHKNARVHTIEAVAHVGLSSALPSNTAQT